jgi:hypothetical protein
MVSEPEQTKQDIPSWATTWESYCRKTVIVVVEVTGLNKIWNIAMDSQKDA